MLVNPLAFIENNLAKSVGSLGVTEGQVNSGHIGTT